MQQILLYSKTDPGNEFVLSKILTNITQIHFATKTFSPYTITLFPGNVPTTFQVHLTKKHSLECQHYRCKFCPEQIFHNQISAEMHVSQHIPRLSDTSRKTAFGPFPFRNDFNSRVERMVKNLQCPFCRQCFKGEYLQQMHMIKEHNREVWRLYYQHLVHS